MTAVHRPDKHEASGRPKSSGWRRLGRAVRRRCGPHLDTLLRSCAYAYPTYLPMEPAGAGFVPADERLCRRWRESGPRLARRPSADEILSIVCERERCLDELERRHPDRFAAWLAAWPCAADDPLPYLSTESVDVRSIQWNQLLGGGPDEAPDLRDPA